MPPSGFLKLNVDGSAFGKPGLARIGRALRDDRGWIITMFSKPIGIQESNKAELMAIFVRFKNVSIQGSFRNSHLIVESDSATMVSWINGDTSECWRHNTILNDILNRVDVIR